MERYRFLDHTADGRFRAFGATLEEAFANAALATASLMWDWEAVERRVDIAIEAEGRDAEQLLVNLLNEILYLFETRRFLLADVAALKVVPARKGGSEGPRGAGARGGGSGLRLTALLKGDILSDRYGLHGDVKAATYNDLMIESRPGGVVIQAVVDL